MAESSRHPLGYYLPHVLPFVLTAAAIYLGPMTGLPETVLYPAQTVLTAAALVWFQKEYRAEIRFSVDVAAIAVGIGVFLVWIMLDGYYPIIGRPSAHAPQFSGQVQRVFFLIFRLSGAAFVIPFAEELFWRSFALRVLIRSDFKAVPLGQFAWFSFLVVSLAFGLEHYRWLPGIVAGMAYAATLYSTRNLFSPIQSHAVTNLLLGVYVLSTGHWTFW